MSKFIVGRIELQRELYPVIEFAKLLGLTAKIVYPKPLRKPRHKSKKKK